MSLDSFFYYFFGPIRYGLEGTFKEDMLSNGLGFELRFQMGDSI